MSKKAKDGTVGPWAKEKLDALGRYLDYYTKVLKNQTWCKGTIFIDAFAGPGTFPIRTSGSEEQALSLLLSESSEFDEGAIEFVNGSPVVALEVQNPLSHYVFIDSDTERIQQLETLRSEYGGGRSIEIRPGDANAQITALLARDIDWQQHRGVCFLDPWGIQETWEMIERLAQTRAMEVFVNFPLMGIQRLLPQSGDIPESWKKLLGLYFGSTEWDQHAYHQEDTLFGERRTKLPDAGIRLLNWYRERLKAIFGHVSSARLIKNTRGGHLYYLVWAGSHEMGLKGANYILSMGEKVKSTSGQ